MADVEFLTERPGETSGRGRQAPQLVAPVTAELKALLVGIPDCRRWRRAREKKAVRRRRGMSIRAYVGPNGSFKSATACFDLLPTLRGIRWQCDEPDHAHTQAGIFEGYRLVLSTVRMTTPDGEDHPLYRRLDDWRMVLGAEHCELFFDEVTGIANSRDAMGLPRQVQVILDQLRKRDVTLLFTAPSFQRADTTLRTVAVGITECRGYLSERSGSAAVSAWRRRRLARARTFAAEDFADWTDGKRERLKPEIVQWWWGPKSEVFVSYSSKGSVARLGQANDAGRCLECGGRRTVPVCTCER
jgi:hypothetical protein